MKLLRYGGKSGLAAPEEPVVFNKWITCICG